VAVPRCAPALSSIRSLGDATSERPLIDSADDAPFASYFSRERGRIIEEMILRRNVKSKFSDVPRKTDSRLMTSIKDRCAADVRFERDIRNHVLTLPPNEWIAEAGLAVNAQIFSSRPDEI